MKLRTFACILVYLHYLMRKKIFVLVAAVLCSALVAMAQPEAGTFSITPKVGLNVSTLTGDPTMTVSYETGNDQIIPPGSMGVVDGSQQKTLHVVAFSKNVYRYGWRAGVEAAYQLTDKFALAAELKYSLQGANYDDFEIPAKHTDGYNLDATTVSNISLSQHYIQLPVLARYYVARGFAIQAGLQPGYCVSNKLSTDLEYGGKTMDVVDDKTDLLSKFDLSIPVGISYEAYGIVLDARYNFGITNVYGGSWDGGTKPTSRNSVVEISLGYRFDM